MIPEGCNEVQVCKSGVVDGAVLIGFDRSPELYVTYRISAEDAMKIGEVAGLRPPGTTRTQIIPQFNFCPHCGEALR